MSEIFSELHDVPTACRGCRTPNWRLRKVVVGLIIVAVSALIWVAEAGAKSAGTALACVTVDPSHAAWTTVLDRHVKDGWVDYSGLRKSGRAQLDSYLKTLASACSADYATWSREQRLAYWINAYNAYTIALVLKHYPLDSIRDIGLLPGAAWRETFIPIRLTGEDEISLNDIEHEILRKQFNEPRIHFSLVCATKSCPILRSEAFRAADLEAQLADQTRTFLLDPTKNRVDAKGRTLQLSPIFNWFRGDFEKSAGTVTKFITGYVDAETARALPGAEIEFLDYDWSLNGG